MLTVVLMKLKIRRSETSEDGQANASQVCRGLLI